MPYSVSLSFFDVTELFVDTLRSSRVGMLEKSAHSAFDIILSKHTT